MASRRLVVGVTVLSIAVLAAPFLAIRTPAASAQPLQAPAGGTAASAVGAAVTVVAAGCQAGNAASTDAALGADGTTRGFVRFEGGTCTDDRIWWFGGAGSHWSRVRSPYHGRVLAVADDGTATYLLYEAPDGIRASKRTRAGAFTPGRLLAPLRPGGTVIQGDLIAAGGSWWAVWTEPVGPGGETAPTSLFQAKTYGSDRARQRITLNGRDRFPTLALRPGGGAVLAWSRGLAGSPFRSDLRVATSGDGTWSSRTFATGGVNANPDLFTAGHVTLLAWQRADRPVLADNHSGRFVTSALPRTGFEPHVAASLGRVFVAFSACCATPARALLAQRTGSAWTVTDLTPAGSSVWIASAVTVRAGKASVLFVDEGHHVLLASSQR